MCSGAPVVDRDECCVQYLRVALHERETFIVDEILLTLNLDGVPKFPGNTENAITTVALSRGWPAERPCG